MPPKNRLKKELVKDIVKRGKAAKNSNVFLKYLFIPGRTKSFSFIVSSKVSKRAVLRNKLKRRARAAVLELLPQVKNGYLVVVFFKKNNLGMNFGEIKNELTSLFQKAGMISSGAAV